MICPRCQNPIPDNSESCRCGWKERIQRQVTTAYDQPRTDCGYDGCNTEAFCKVKAKTGWLNVCDRHYRQYHHDKAEAHCANLGLDTQAQRRQWLQDHWPAMRAYETPREPGEDPQE